MRKLSLLCAVLCVTSMTFAQTSTAPRHDGGTTATFVFRSGDDVFYRLTGNNNAELKRRYEFVELHKAAIRNGESPVHVHGYSSGLASSQENLRSARIRANRVKSDLIIKKGLREADFRTKNSATAYGKHKSAVVVTINLPAPEVARHDQHQSADWLKGQKDNLDRITALQNKVTDLQNKVQVLANRPPVIEEKTIIEKIAMREPEGWREPYSFALRTNFLYWAGLLPNIGIEWRAAKWFGLKVDGHFSDWTFNEKRTHKMWMVSPELRFYLGQEGRIYVGLGGNYGQADMSWKPYSRFRGHVNHGYKGHFYNGGLVLGYQARLTKKLSFDFNLGFGMTHYKYDTYALGNDTHTVVAKDQTKNVWGLTQAGATLVWRFGRKNYHNN